MISFLHCASQLRYDKILQNMLQNPEDNNFSHASRIFSIGSVSHGSLKFAAASLTEGITVLLPSQAECREKNFRRRENPK